MSKHTETIKRDIANFLLNQINPKPKLSKEEIEKKVFIRNQKNAMELLLKFTDKELDKVCNISTRIYKKKLPISPEAPLLNQILNAQAVIAYKASIRANLKLVLIGEFEWLTFQLIEIIKRIYKKRKIRVLKIIKITRI